MIGNGKRYSVILADPPWTFADKSLHRGGAQRHYNCMTPRELWELNVMGIAARDAVLFMWCTHPIVARGTHTYVADGWGFELKTLAFDWVKVDGKNNPSWGMGHWTRSNSEPCYIGIRGNPERVSAAVHQIIMEPDTADTLIAPRGRHSEKPSIVRDRIVELCGDVPRIELFARGAVPEGWDLWGNEAA